MIRVHFLLTVLVCFLVATGVEGAERAAGEGKVPPAPADAVVDTSESSETGYAETGPCGECCSMDAGCCPVGVGCASVWTVEAGAIFLNRDRANARPSAKVFGSETGQTTPSMIFDGAASDIGMGTGYDITLTRCLGPCWDLEARYFQIDGWNDTHTFENYGRTYISAYGTTANAISPSTAYSSRMYNIELNLRWKNFDRMPLLMGFRTLGLDERFQIISNGVVGTSWAETNTNNGLYGLQIGAEPILWDRCGRFRLESTIKAGIYGNSVHQRTRFPTVGGELNSRQEGSPSFVGEIGLIGALRLNKYWSLRGGYEVMWITNVALAPDQASTITFGSAPIGTMDDKAIAFYYGATASIERRF